MTAAHNKRMYTMYHVHSSSCSMQFAEAEIWNLVQKLTEGGMQCDTDPSLVSACG